MSKQQPQPGLIDGLMHPGMGRNPSLDQIAAQVDWSAFERVLAPLRASRVGAPAYPALIMLKALLLQQWYQLSDPGLEEALSDRLSFRRFLGLSLEDATPDHSTLWRFRAALRQSGLDAQLFTELERQLQARGLIIRKGTLADATLVQAQGRRPPDGEAPSDPQARLTKKGSRYVYGYKAHIAVDQDSGLVRRAILTPANVNDTCQGDALICGDEAAYYADAAYDTHARRAQLRARGIVDAIIHRPNKHHPILPTALKAVNQRIRPIRARVETIFAIWKRHYGYTRVRYFGLERNQVHLTLLAMATNLRRMRVLTT